MITPSLSPPASTRSRLLLVEDDPDQRMLLSRWLRNYDVTCAGSAPHAYEMMDNHDFDLVVTDVVLPGKQTGIDVVRTSKQRAPLRPVLVMTATASVTMAVEALRYKADEFLQKPLRKDNVLERVGALLRGAKKVALPKKRVLAIGAHPDDVEIGVGGTLLSHRRAGDEITIVTLTNGACGGAAGIRANEAMAAASMLGAKLIMGDFVDTEIRGDGNTIRFLETAFKKCNPDVVYVHSPHDRHQDHRAVHQAAMVAARGTSEIFAYQSPSTTAAFSPTRFSSIESEVKQKLSLLSHYRSQAERAYLEEEFVVSTARYWGRFASYKMVEPLEVLKTA